MQLRTVGFCAASERYRGTGSGGSMMQGCRVLARALSAQVRYHSVDAKHVLKQIEACEISSQPQLSREPLSRAGGGGGARTFATSSLLTKENERGSSGLRKPRSLALEPESSFRVVDSAPPGFQGTMLKLLGYYSRQSRLIRGANTLYARISSRVNQPELYANFVLERSFRTTHAMLVVYMWLCLCRLRTEGKDGAAVGQSMYDAFNHDLERRILATGLKVLLSKWMKELEKNFYGAVAAYDVAMQPAAAQDELAKALWRNVFAEDDAIMPAGPNAAPVHALARYVRRETACLALTDSESILSGNIFFSDDYGAVAE